jgi:hypothetical protein
MKSQDSILGVVTRLCIWCSEFSVSSAEHLAWLWGPLSVIHWLPGLLFPGVMQPGCQDNYLFQSSVKVKNEWNYNSAVPICHHSMYTNNCTQNSYVIQMSYVQVCLSHWCLYYWFEDSNQFWQRCWSVHIDKKYFPFISSDSNHNKISFKL